jgi:hypothetical protein
MNYNVDQIKTIIAEARHEAYLAADQFFKDKLGGKDQYSCGFAWVDIFGIKGNTKLGKAFKEAGVRKSYLVATKFGIQRVMLVRTSTPWKLVQKRLQRYLRSMVSRPMLDRG